MRPGNESSVCGEPRASSLKRDGRGLGAELELLQWLPGETLYSLVSRHHRLWGHRLAGQTAQVLFGNSRRGYQHDFPGGLKTFVGSTGCQLGDVDSLCMERTLLRYYRPFLTATQEQAVVATMAGASVAHLKYRLGLLTSRFRAHHPLKGCQRCIDEDRDQTGWAWWHMDHQYPGVWICPRHGAPLRESLSKSNGVERFQWLLPDARRLHRASASVELSGEEANSCFARIARLVGDVVDRRPIVRIDPETLRAHYRNALAERGLMSARGRVALAAAAEDFLQHVRPLRVIAEFEALPKNSHQAQAQLVRLLAPMRSGTHPLRHLVLIDWLIGPSAALFSRLEDHVSATAQASDDARKRPSAVNERYARHAELATLIRGGMSMRAAAETLGIDTQTAMVWAAQSGIEASRRPKLLKGDARRNLIAALQRGTSKAEAATGWEISITTVTAVLRSVPGLHDKWREAQHNKARTSARRRWNALLNRCAALGVKFMRNKEPAAYAWLYRHDRTWLNAHTPIRLRRGGTVRVDWTSRDIELSAAVQRAARLARSTLGDQPLRQWHLIQAMPELKPKLRRLDRLPLTAQAVQDALHGRQRTVSSIALTHRF